MTTLENLWYGNVIPHEQFLDGSDKLKELLLVMAKDREKLSAGFSPEQTERLNKYDDIINEMHSIAEVEAFRYGFRLAAALLIESTT